MEKEYIEREELVRHCKRIIEAEHNQISAPSSWSFAYEQFIEDLEEEPAADVEEVRHGLWETTDTPLGRCCICSVCGSCPTMEYRYCPYCGAKMDGKGEECKDDD